jgi:hypothetical protein
MSNRDRHTAVYTMSPDGSNQLQVGVTSVANAFPTWSPDSSQIAAAYSNDVYVFPSTGGAGVNLTKKGFHAISPAWSPDGSQIAFFSDYTRWDNGIVSFAVANPAAWVDVTGDQAKGQRADNRYPDWVPGGPLAAVEVTDAGCGSVKTSPLGTRLQFNFRSATPHTAVDATGLGLFNAGTHTAPYTAWTSLFAAGQYGVQCGGAPGVVSVPMAANRTKGKVTATFTVSWASVAAPSGDVYDVQVKRLGAATYTPWQTGVTVPSAAFKPDAKAGAYAFQARLRNPSSGAATQYSAPLTITVQP